MSDCLPASHNRLIATAICRFSLLFFYLEQFCFTQPCYMGCYRSAIWAVQFSSVPSLSGVWLFATPWTIAWQVSLSITNFQRPPKPMSIESVMPSNHLILCHPLLLLPPIPPRIRVFSNESALCIRWPKYWSFSFNICLSNEHPGLISFRMDWLDLLAVQGTLTSQLKSVSSLVLSFLYSPTLMSIHDYWKNNSLD